MSTTVAKRVTRVIMDHLGVEDEQASNPKAHFGDDLGADSLDRVELTMGLEEEFGFEIDDDDAEKLLTVGDVLNYIGKRVDH